MVLQPKQRPNGQLPYPYFIDETGMVGRQDFWKGEPLELIGVDINPTDHGMSGKSIDLKDILKDPEKAIGMYPIFKNSNDEWHTYDEPIESVSVRENE